MKQSDFHEKLIEMCISETKRANEMMANRNLLNRLQFTKDNFVKLVLIYFRLKSRQPVIIMGETGVGKTSLVNFLSELMNAVFLKLYLHAGIEEKDIIKFVKEAIKKAGDKQHKNQQIVMFLDEINTNEHINGLLKEIIIDRHI